MIISRLSILASLASLVCVVFSSGCTAPGNDVNGLLLSGPVEPPGLDTSPSASSLPNDPAGKLLGFDRSSWKTLEVRIPSDSVYVFPTYGPGDSARMKTFNRDWPVAHQMRQPSPNSRMVFRAFENYGEWALDLLISPVRMCIDPPWTASAQPGKENFSIFPSHLPIPPSSIVMPHRDEANEPSVPTVGSSDTTPENPSIPGARISSPKSD